MSTINKIRLKGVDYDIAGGGGSVDAYTKTESDERYAPKGEFASVSGDVENALGEIAALGIDKQDKLSGNYLSKVEVGGSSLSIETKAFKDESVQKTDNINFKTINGQAIFGMGNIQIDGGGGTGAKEWNVKDMQKINNSELPFYKVKVGDIIITADSKNQVKSKYLVLSKYEYPEDAIDTYQSVNYLVLIDAEREKLIQLSINAYNATQEQDWFSYTYNETEIGGGGGVSLPDKEVISDARFRTEPGKDNTPVLFFDYNTYNLKNSSEGSTSTNYPIPVMYDVWGGLSYTSSKPFAICVCTQSEYNSAPKNPNVLYIING